MKKAENICLFDLDGTLCDYTGQMKRDLLRLKGPEEPDYENMFDSREKLPDHIWNRVTMIKEQEGWWRNLPKLRVGFDIYRAVKSVGFDVHVLTKGPSNTHSAWTEKVQWCRANLAYKDKVTITEDKGIAYGKLLVDDFPEYIERWLENRPRGLVIMPAHPYNRDFKHPNVRRYGMDYEELGEYAKGQEEMEERYGDFAQGEEHCGMDMHPDYQKEYDEFINLLERVRDRESGEDWRD
jgi:phosphoglycolate phosphatase-like HAD superfamily hydrolase